MRRRLEIPAEVASAEGVPVDLDSSVSGPYSIPSPRRRRNAGWVYLVGAALAGGGMAVGLPVGLAYVAGLLVALGVWHFASAWRLDLADSEALQSAAREVGFSVGHASAAVGFDGVRARPVWNVLVFGSDDPPSRRALVRIDAVDGAVLEKYEEPI